MLNNVCLDCATGGEGRSCPTSKRALGPVVSPYRYTTIDDAIARANETGYGLNASVWSKSVPAAPEVANRIETGTVNVNETYASA